MTYRGYYFDWESGLFYLQSRYYCPQLRRFISADVYLDTNQGVLGTNMYAYCLNNPINRIDPDGFSSIALPWVVEAGLTFGTVGVGALALTATPFGFAVAGAALSVGIVYAGVSHSQVIREQQVQNQVDHHLRTQARNAATQAIGEIASGFRNFQCREAAQAMERELNRRNQNFGVVLAVDPIGWRPNRGIIFSISQNRAISRNGMHVGIQFNGRVHCNVHPLGLSRTNWERDFDAAIGLIFFDFSSVGDAIDFFNSGRWRR